MITSTGPRVQVAVRGARSARRWLNKRGWRPSTPNVNGNEPRNLSKTTSCPKRLFELDRTRALTTQFAAVAAQARLHEAEASLDAAQAMLEKTVIAAPFDGVVLDVSTEIGEWISPSLPGVPIPPVLDVIDPEALYLSAPIDEADLARVRVGLPARMTLDAFRGRSFKGKLTYVSSFVRRARNRIERCAWEAEFEESSLPPNLFARSLGGHRSDPGRA